MKIITDTPRHEVVWKMPWDKYRSIDALNPSSIVTCERSPLHVLSAMRGDRPDTPALQVGRAIHSALLEPRIFAESYEPARERRTQAVVDEAAARGVELLLPADFDKAIEAAKRAAVCKDLQPFIRAGNSEVVVLTGECGCQVKGRLDWVSAEPLAILDVKTARDISERKFSRDFYAFHYDVKLGLYQRWLQRVLDVRDIPVYLLLVENQPPYDCQMVPRNDGAAVPLPDAVLMRGASKGLRWIEQIRTCLDRDEWPGAAEVGDWTLQTPVWEMDDDEIEGAEVM
jgi:hypothetical protein